MTALFDDIRKDCLDRGLMESNGKCIYAKHYGVECNEYKCTLARQFCGMRPADLLTKRYNLEEQFEKDMAV